jgi:hypothetical protein
MVRIADRLKKAGYPNQNHTHQRSGIFRNIFKGLTESPGSENTGIAMRMRVRNRARLPMQHACNGVSGGFHENESPFQTCSLCCNLSWSLSTLSMRLRSQPGWLRSCAKYHHRQDPAATTNRTPIQHHLPADCAHQFYGRRHTRSARQGE